MINRAEKSEVASEIMAYLSEHHDAQDTIEGIIQWWLLERKIGHQVAAVKEALDELVEKGLVAVSVGPDSRKRYRAKPK